MYQFSKLFASTLVVTAVSLALSLPAHATVTFTPGNNPQPDEENILLVDMTGSPITGVTNMSNITVDFSSTTDTLIGMGGQARIDASDGFINDLNIYIPGGDYTDIILNPMLKNGDTAGPATVDVTTNMGSSMFTYDLGNGNNYLTIVASGGEKITNTEITSDNGFDNLKQPRISGAELSETRTPVTPEPCTLALLGTGMLPLIGALRRRKA